MTRHQQLCVVEVPAAGLSSSEVSRARARHSPNRFVQTHRSGTHPDAQRQRPRPDYTPATTAFNNSLKTSDIPGAQPRPPYLWSRQTNPLAPEYTLSSSISSSSLMPSTSYALQAPYRPLSRSLDVSDIPGARTRATRVLSPERRLHSSTDYSDVLGTQPRPLSRSISHNVCTLTTQGIDRSTPLSRTGHEVISPGRGTLANADIHGALPGSCSGHAGLPTTWGLGRHPLPTAQNPVFGYGARHNIMQRPPGFKMFDLQ